MKTLFSVFILSCLFSLSSFSDETLPDSFTEPQNETLQIFDGKKLQDFVIVNKDGTLAINEHTKKMLPIGDINKAQKTVEDLNNEILSGNYNAFTKDDSRLQRVGMRSVLCMCRDNCCVGGVCCKKRIFWIFCLENELC